MCVCDSHVRLWQCDVWVRMAMRMSVWLYQWPVSLSQCQRHWHWPLLIQLSSDCVNLSPFESIDYYTGFPQSWKSKEKNLVMESHVISPLLIANHAWEIPLIPYHILYDKNLALYIRDCVSLCLSDETLKGVGPFYLVSMPGEVKDPTSLHWKCVTCRGLHNTTL